MDTHTDYTYCTWCEEQPTAMVRVENMAITHVPACDEHAKLVRKAFVQDDDYMRIGKNDLHIARPSRRLVRMQYALAYRINLHERGIGKYVRDQFARDDARAAAYEAVIYVCQARKVMK